MFCSVLIEELRIKEENNKAGCTLTFGGQCMMMSSSRMSKCIQLPMINGMAGKMVSAICKMHAEMNYLHKQANEHLRTLPYATIVHEIEKVSLDIILLAPSLPKSNQIPKPL